MKYHGEKVLTKLYEDIEDYWHLHMKLLSALDNTYGQITTDLLKMARKSRFIATLNKDQNFLDAKERMIQKGLTPYDFLNQKILEITCYHWSMSFSYLYTQAPVGYQTGK